MTLGERKRRNGDASCAVFIYFICVNYILVVLHLSTNPHIWSRGDDILPIHEKLNNWTQQYTEVAVKLFIVKGTLQVVQCKTNEIFSKNM